MKKLLFLSSLSAIAALTALAGMFSTISGFTMKEIKPKAEYTLDTAGFNPRVYEFVPLNDKTKLCVVIFGHASDRSGQSALTMQCFTKGKGK